jgi:glycosyltransferase involved in cell wall biosynthesis
MNILNISQILPIPGFYKTNDFVFKLSDHLKSQFPEDNHVFLRPLPITNRFFRMFLQSFSIVVPGNLTKYQYGNHKATICKFFSAWRINNLHAILAYSIYWLNRGFIRSTLQENQISVVHAQFILPDGLLALLLKKKYNIPYIVTTHTELKYFNSYLSRKVATTILKNAFRITPLNYRNLNFFKSLGLNNYEVIPLGIDNDFFKKNVRHVTGNEFRILTLGDLIGLKNIDKVLTAISLLKNKYNIRYTVIGKGPQEEFLRTMSASLGINDKVDFHGFITYDKIPGILSQYDLFIMPSYPETFGRVYFEAMAVGLPVICAVNSGIYGYFPDLVDRYAVDPTKPEEIAERISFFIENKEKLTEIGNNLQFAVKEYTWAKISVRVRELYNQAEKTNRKQS